MNTKDQGRGRRQLPTADHPEVRLVIGAAHRLPGLLDHAVDDAPADPTVAEVVAAAAPHAHAAAWMLTGGEPTLRADFPELVRTLAEAGAPALGIVTDGLALANEGLPAMLARWGLQRVRVRLAGARADAHDWLMGQQGAWKRAVRALKLCADAGLETEVECTVTRPTAPYTEEAVELFVRLGARAVVLRRLTARGPAADHDVTLMPRFGLVQRELERAVQAGVRHGAAVMVEGFPRCALPGVAAHHLPTDAVVWALPSSGAWPYLQPRYEAPDAERGCAGCPGPPGCAGAPVDYTRRFGRTEIDSESPRRIHPGTVPPTPLVGGDVYPPARQGRHPATRVSYAQLAARLPSLGGDPLVALRAEAVPATLRFVFLAPPTVAHPVLGDHPGVAVPESTRDVRVRLVKAAQHGAQVVRFAGGGTLGHPDLGELLREATRLQLPRIEVAGEGGPLDTLSDMQIRRLRGIGRVDVALFAADPDAHDAIVGRAGAFDAALRALDRIGAMVPSIELGAYAVITDPAQVAAFAEAWDMGDLPGDPWFRLAPTGGSLTALARAAEALPAGRARDALAAVLPRAVFDRPDHVVPAPQATLAWGDVPTAQTNPSGSDRYGWYTGRPSAASEPVAGDDPGIAAGWSIED